MPTLTDIYNGAFVVLPVTIGSNQANYNPAGLSSVNILEVTLTASIKISSLAAQANGKVITIVNFSTDFLLWLEHENTNDTAINRFNLPDAFPAFLMPGDSITLYYSTTNNRWNVLNWPNKGQAMGLNYFVDWVNNGSGMNMVTANGGVVGASGFKNDTIERPFGTVALSTGTAANGVAGCYGTNYQDVVPTLGPLLTVNRLAIQVLSTAGEDFIFRSGFFSSGFVDSVSWMHNASNSTWFAELKNNSATTFITAGFPIVDTNFIWLVTFFNSNWSRVDFIYSTDSMSFLLANSGITNIPVSSRVMGWSPGYIFKQVGTASRNAVLDISGYRSIQLRRG